MSRLDERLEAVDEEERVLKRPKTAVYLVEIVSQRFVSKGAHLSRGLSFPESFSIPFGKRPRVSCGKSRGNRKDSFENRALSLSLSLEEMGTDVSCQRPLSFSLSKFNITVELGRRRERERQFRDSRRRHRLLLSSALCLFKACPSIFHQGPHVAQTRRVYLTPQHKTRRTRALL